MAFIVSLIDGDAANANVRNSLDTGLYQPDVVRAKLVGGTVEIWRIMSALRDTDYRGKVMGLDKASSQTHSTRVLGEGLDYSGSEGRIPPLFSFAVRSAFILDR